MEADAASFGTAGQPGLRPIADSSPTSIVLLYGSPSGAYCLYSLKWATGFARA